MHGYITFQKTAEARLTEKRSVFIGSAAPVKNESEALAFLVEIKKRYSDAKHHVYAYLLRENNIARYSDDGEPKGTGGLPVLQVMKKGAFSDAVIVVTRYFGGILLGTGGLTRAYTQAAAAAAAAAGTAEYRPISTYCVETAFRDGEKIKYVLSRYDCRIDDVVYADHIRLIFSVLPEQATEVVDQITELSAGKARIENLGTALRVWEPKH